MIRGKETLGKKKMRDAVPILQGENGDVLGAAMGCLLGSRNGEN